MRILQSTLLYGHTQQLLDYIESLKQKIKVKDRYKISQNNLYDANPIQKSPNKITRNYLSDSDKENKFYLTNTRANAQDNGSKNDSFLSTTLN